MKVTLLGDSHMQVLGPILKRLVPGVTYYAKPGWSVKKWAASPPGWRGADVAVIALGGNDREKDIKKYEQDARRLLQGAPKRVIWIGPSTAKGEIGAWHERTRKLQAEVIPRLGATWVDSTPWTSSGWRSDGVHFTSEGYRRWAEGIAGALKSAPSSSSTLWYVGGAVLAAVGLAAWRRRST